MSIEHQVTIMCIGVAAFILCLAAMDVAERRTGWRYALWCCVAMSGPVALFVVAWSWGAP